MLDVHRDTDSIACYGLCGRTYHVACLANDNQYYKNNKKTLVDSLRKVPNLHWYCDNCQPLTVNGISNTLKECASSVTTLQGIIPILLALCNCRASQPSLSTVSTDNTSTAVLSNSNEASVNVNVASSDVPTNTNDPSSIECMVVDDANAAAELNKPLYSFVLNSLSTQSPALSKKRKNDSQLSPIPPKVQRTNQSITPNRIASAPAPTPTRTQKSSHTDAANNSTQILAGSKCIYVSKFKPETADSVILRHLTSIGVATSAIQCKKLVREHSRNTLSFVSFKIIAPANYADIILSSRNWPKNTIVREFVDKTPIARNQAAQRKPHNNSQRNATSKSRNAMYNPRAHHQMPLHQPMAPYVPRPQLPTQFFPNAAYPQQMLQFPCYLPRMPPYYQQQMSGLQLVQ